jgi:hypothetical protein
MDHVIELVDRHEAARRLGVTRRFLENVDFRGNGPPHYRYSRAVVRYDAKELDAWQAKRLVKPTR